MTLGRGRGASNDNQGVYWFGSFKFFPEGITRVPKPATQVANQLRDEYIYWFQDFISWNQILKRHLQQITPLNWIEKTEMTIQTPTPPAAGDSASHVLSATCGRSGTEVSFGPQIRLCSWKVFQLKPLILGKRGHHSHVTTPSYMRICVTLDTTKTVPDSSRVWASIPELPNDCSNAPILSPKRSWQGKTRSVTIAGCPPTCHDRFVALIRDLQWLLVSL